MSMHILIILIEKKTLGCHPTQECLNPPPPKENKQQKQHNRTVTRIMVSIKIAAIDQE